MALANKLVPDERANGNGEARGNESKSALLHMGDCQNYGPFLGPYCNTGPNTGPNLGDPKRDHNFDNPPTYQFPDQLCCSWDATSEGQAGSNGLLEDWTL